MGGGIGERTDCANKFLDYTLLKSLGIMFNVQYHNF